MSKCKDCNGRGHWVKSTLDADGYVQIISMYCESCKGTGIDQDPEKGQDWDIGGDSYEDDK